MCLGIPMQVAVRSAWRGEGAGPSLAAATRVCAETIHEHLWCLFIDWRQLAGLAPRAAAMSAARQGLSPLLEGEAGARESAGAALAELTAAAVYGSTPAAWLAISDADALAAWSREAATPAAALYSEMLREAPFNRADAIALLPDADEAMLRASVVAALEAEPDYELAPHWRGEARETGRLARMARHPAVGAVLAARGALEIDVACESELERRARWLAASLDPCVALRLEINHA